MVTERLSESCMIGNLKLAPIVTLLAMMIRYALRNLDPSLQLPKLVLPWLTRFKKDYRPGLDYIYLRQLQPLLDCKLCTPKENNQNYSPDPQEIPLVRGLGQMQTIFSSNVIEGDSPLSKTLSNLFNLPLIQKHDILTEVTWKPPPPSWIKINSDGSLGDDCFAVGVVIRDPSGDCLLAMAARTRVASINVLELKARGEGERAETYPAQSSVEEEGTAMAANMSTKVGS
ncbi:hypothetical protein QJS10_CPA01g01567 [Acorus calamus]|uniref:RNase H type-1 domain-containing protein n=1 Tax=Acorus calamus TaxID=4465 RepID=A0AAV9FJX8_ACOCL|nr:hypothetical protein QJS10_CPA01g01567 [Acorus calamus]